MLETGKSAEMSSYARRISLRPYRGSDSSKKQIEYQKIMREENKFIARVKSRGQERRNSRKCQAVSKTSE